MDNIDLKYARYLGPSIAAAAITAGAQLGSNFLGKLFGDDSAKKQFQMQKQLIDEQNEYNKPVNQLARFEQAGINPVYALGGGSLTAGNQDQQGQAPDVASARQGAARNLQDAMQSGVDTYLQAKQVEQSNKESQSRIELNKAQELKLQKDADWADRLNQSLIDLQESEVLSNEALTDLRIIMQGTERAKQDEISQSIQKMCEEIETFKVERSLVRKKMDEIDSNILRNNVRNAIEKKLADKEIEYKQSLINEAVELATKYAEEGKTIHFQRRLEQLLMPHTIRKRIAEANREQNENLLAKLRVEVEARFAVFREALALIKEGYELGIDVVTPDWLNQ